MGGLSKSPAKMASGRTGLPDQSVNLGNVDIVELLDGISDLWLVSSDVCDEYQCVVIFDFLHGRLSGILVQSLVKSREVRKIRNELIE